MVRSRADLDSMSTDDPRRWIQSQGWEQSISRAAKQAALLNLARWLWDNPDIAHSGPIKPDEVQSRGDLERLSKSGLYTWVLSHDYQATAWTSLPRKEALEKARAVATPKDPPAKNYNHNHTIKDIKHPETRLDLLSTKHKELFAWLKFHDIRTGKGKRLGRISGEAKNMKKDKALALAQKTWDAAENGTIDKMKKRRQWSRNSVKIPQVRKDFQQMTKKDLQQWINSHEFRVKDLHRTNKDVVAQAEEIWDAINDNTLDESKKRDHARRTQRGRSERIDVS
ncbi:hypothetical protein MMC30_009129 [Trapelia coarctata]|nr:hypothetical protein [Trapelia coarctata]